jgi:uncharacterized protein YycO
MKKLVIIVCFFIFFTCNKTTEQEFMDGDIIFQTSLSPQSKAIQLATKSKYSHMGIIYKQGDEIHVYEAIQPVKYTPLNKWIARGKNGRYVVKRLKNYDNILTDDVLHEMKSVGEKYKGKNYDPYFGWSDDRIYCSELVWKIYKQAVGIEIGSLQKIKEFDLSDPIVKNKIKERYGENLPEDELVISPASIFQSDLLYTVYSN